jgi:hypothetical protein
MAKQGYGIEKIKSILNTTKLVNTFLVLHEQDHIDHKDKDVYWNMGKKDLLTPDKIAIETRASINALKKIEASQPSTQPTQRKTYSGKVTSLQPNQIFVFGSNPEGRHGAGAAKYAKDNFGAIYGQGEGLQGQSYALPTKDLRVKENKSLRSISPEQITSNIRTLYTVARENPTKEFLVSDYSETNLNGYTGQEMANMFVNAGPIPTNIVFNENFDKLVSTTQPTTQPSTSVKPTIDTIYNKEGFNYLSSQIYENFGYINKGFDISEAPKEIILKFTPVTDQDVIDFINKCFIKP